MPSFGIVWTYARQWCARKRMSKSLYVGSTVSIYKFNDTQKKINYTAPITDQKNNTIDTALSLENTSLSSILPLWKKQNGNLKIALPN